MFAVGAGKSKEKLAAAVLKQLPRIQWAMGVVGFVQSMLFFKPAVLQEHLQQCMGSGNHQSGVCDQSQLHGVAELLGLQFQVAQVQSSGCLHAVAEEAVDSAMLPCQSENAVADGAALVPAGSVHCGQ